ncbi:5'-methylthioadenosine/S-adenosylhomocysteine nucleosidase [Streptomyces halstedii]|uniref:5'-methylthioadenosine/S-adenosylhomocysteine nucleosidase n=1 Tax=Streptomyces halstedii TaxID=1944 RepID=A0ABS6TTJ5_STRHA|nr:5'-methylthioadenosine/S-adenosylhomocysteine nucleosidase [Streptomyces halstedii]MBV7671547.1 5'-methylthioadenosine/S-adenosylhomocysteine nucleosidase [Streptomyces halstedii]
MKNNRGIVSHGDHNTFSNNAIGEHAHASGSGSSQHFTRPAQAGLGDELAATGWDIGVVTILSEELRSVVDELKLERHKVAGGLYFYQGEHTTPEATVRIVATQSQSQGQRSAMAALENLRRHYAPRLWALVGVGGGIHDQHARIGNVIVSTEIVYYENRKINPLGDVRRRGEHRQAPAPVVHAVNAFFADHGTPARIHGQLATHVSEEFEVYPGLIGSGEAVIADRESDIRDWLKKYHEKVLAVDMEAGGLSQYWQENSVRGETNPGWIVIRGVSDNADQEKGHGFHELAARNAAYILRELLPYLC